jgi:hypothetical protein
MTASFANRRSFPLARCGNRGGAVVAALIVAGNGLVVHAAERRARPPQFPERQYADVFFKDPLAELSGPRPSFGQGAMVADRARPGVDRAADEAESSPTNDLPAVRSDPESTAGEGSGWKNVVSAETLEDEIKRLKLAFDGLITTPTSFRDGGYTDARQVLTGLAAWMGVIAQYDGEVRWKASAAAARDILAKTADNCKVASEQSFSSAKQRKADLQELLSGSASLPPPVESEVAWPEVADHGVLMAYLEELFTERLKPSSSGSLNPDERAAVIRDAELIAAVSRILQQPGMVHADETEYAALALSMERAGIETREAMRAEDLPRVREAVGRIGKSCTNCHAEYQ